MFLKSGPDNFSMDPLTLFLKKNQILNKLIILL